MESDIVETPAPINPSPTMTITVNGKVYALENTPRLRWSDIGRLADIPMGPRGKWTNNGKVSIVIPGEDKPREFLHGHSLIVVDGMAITATP